MAPTRPLAPGRLPNMQPAPASPAAAAQPAGHAKEVQEPGISGAPGSAQAAPSLLEGLQRPTMASPDLQAFRARILKEWTADLTVDGWRKWHTPIARATAEVSQLIVPAGDIKPGMRVLDLASGSGEPAFTLAHAVGPAGHVVASDLGQGMLGIAEAQAAQHGVKNMTFKQANMEALPFPDNSFDRVTCRWGLMFVPDHVQALREIDRVLKPGGKVVIVAWGPLMQPFFAGPRALKKLGLLPTPPVGAHTPFKFSEPGTLTTAMSQAGLRGIKESAEQSGFNWPGTPETFFQWFYDIAAPFRPLFDSLDPKTFEAVTQEIYAIARPHVDGDMLRLGAQVVVGVADCSKPPDAP